MCAPHPHPSFASFKCGGRSEAGPAPLSKLPGGKDHRPGTAGQGGSISSAPTPSLSATGIRLPSPTPHLFLFSSFAAAAAASAPAGSAWLLLCSLRLPQPISARLLPWPRSLTPSFLPST